MVCELSDFPPGPADGQIPLCKIDGDLHYSSPEFLNLHVYTSSVSDHPNVVISRDVLQPSLRKSYEGKVFLPTPDSMLQRLQDAWYECGIIRVLEVLSQTDGQPPSLFQRLASNILFACNIGKQLKEKFFSPSEERYFRGDEARVGPVICMSWHPSNTKLAIGTTDDSVSIFSVQTRITPVLKSKAQRRITDIAWRPLTAGELAVGCADGIALWNVDPNSFVARPSSSTAVVLRHSYVTSIAWSPQGDILVSCNGMDKSIVVWHVDTKERIAVPCAGGASFLLWNPSLSKLMAATLSKTFRLWSTEKWDCETWTTAGGRVTAAAWSHDGNCLLFATSALPYIYCLQRDRDLFGDAPPASIVANTTFVQIPGTEDMIGGEVKKMDWDSESRHLAVLFSEGHYVAVYITSLGTTLNIQPGFLIKGISDEIPTCFSFQKDFVDGANLTICWSTGRVQYFPMVYKRNLSSTFLRSRSAL
ncbi:unnamed protein product [Nezara viridula]|uniref:Aladin seven-bladed propeller domain-containing protein n=1 Tax=Nezara viridula TaxID=85310 RepID=A0A9P0GZ55_NEZVI|nr:unnamed protein product [Nezara viridula]